MVKKFRKIPVEIEAVKFLNTKDNVEEIQAWANLYDVDIVWVTYQCILTISTLEGVMSANEGDWIIKGINNEFYPCKPDIFEKTYEEVL